MNLKTAITLFLLFSLVSCSSTRLSKDRTQEKEETAADSRMYWAEPSFRR